MSFKIEILVNQNQCILFIYLFIYLFIFLMLVEARCASKTKLLELSEHFSKTITCPPPPPPTSPSQGKILASAWKANPYL